MRPISELNSRESGLKSTLKKGYPIVFLVCIILFIVGFIITSVANFIPEVDWDDPDYDDYELLMTRLSTLSILFQNIGIALFSLSTFLGALADGTLSKEVKRGMAIASAIGIVALVVFNRLLFLIYVT